MPAGVIDQYTWNGAYYSNWEVLQRKGVKLMFRETSSKKEVIANLNDSEMYKIQGGCSKQYLSKIYKLDRSSVANKLESQQGSMAEGERGV
ncbi:MAG TPA: class I lanthipeptide [Mariniphaga sp.]|nr:class I lanthipeptide [Mariniphaga sp.]